MESPTTEQQRPAFLITIDTEGDNLWSRPREITTRNAHALPRCQALCERYGLKPTWLTNYEMVQSVPYQEFASDVVARGAGEIGMHLHAWNSPPVVPLTADDYRYQPYLIEYSDHLLREKVVVLTRCLEDTFGIPMRSHRAGRWALDGRYVSVLHELGYTTDCSVTPTISWRHARGAPSGQGGADYTAFPRAPYWMDLRDFSRAGQSTLLQVPMTTTEAHPLLSRMVPDAWQRGPLGGIRHKRRWLRPLGGNRADMLRLVEQGRVDGRAHLEFMIHSSELMAGGSPRFRTDDDVERLYEDMEAVFSTAQSHCLGATLTEFHRMFAASNAQEVQAACSL